MAPILTLIPVEEYLRTTYRPDRDYINGEVRERNMGEKPHARLQKFFLQTLSKWEDQEQIEVLPEQRLYINSECYRVPDVIVIRASDPDPRIVHQPPMLCVEILSSEDRMRRVQERLDDYATIGVQTMWVIDPWRGLAYAAGPDAKLQPVTDRLTVPKTEISIDVAAIFDELERLERRADTSHRSNSVTE